MDLENASEFKLFAAALICALALGGGVVPLLLRARQGEGADSGHLALITSGLNMFAGGIFLSGAVLHLLPDAQKNEALAHWMCDSTAADENGCFNENPLLALVVFAALSFHSVMEGMGLGAAPHAVWDVLAAVLAHKSLAAFALVQELLQRRVSRRRVLASIGVFSVMTPVGILLGSVVAAHAATGESVASGVCTALAGGTFLFVAVVETLPQELRDRRNLALNCGALLVGYGAMGALSLWT